MPFDLVGWIVVGLLAGWLSGVIVDNRTARGCLPNLLVGVLGGILGGWLARTLGFEGPASFLGAVVVAFAGAVIVRIVIGAVTRSSR